MTKETTDRENNRVATDRGKVHLWKEGTFLRAYEWSAWLCCRYLHDFKVTKRAFKGIDEPVAYIGFPDTFFFGYPSASAIQQEKGAFFCEMTEKH